MTEQPIGPDPDPPLKRVEKITIMLKEYDALRAEIISRINSRWQMTGLAIGLLSAIGFARSDASYFWVFAAIAAIFLLVLWRQSILLMRHCGLRIAEIENRVNELGGDELLAWESRAVTQRLSLPNRW